MTQTQGFATRAIHLAHDPMDHQGALTPPLHLTSTFAFETAEAGGEIFAGERPGHVYSRISNPTLDLLERRVAALEGAEAGLALASGMGAVTAVLWTLLSPGGEVLGTTFDITASQITAIALLCAASRTPSGGVATVLSSPLCICFFREKSKFCIGIRKTTNQWPWVNSKNRSKSVKSR